MGWEKRNGQEYYYQKKRVGGKVISRYIGNGTAADMIADTERNRKGVFAALQLTRKIEQEEAKKREKDFAAYFAEVEAIFCQAMNEAGYYRHKRGEWRKRRGKG